MAEFMMIHDLKDPTDPQGRTYRQVNLAKTHAIPIGALVEFVPHGDCDRREGVRLYVVYRHRDCDGTPLYALAADRHDTEQEDPRFHNRKWVHGIPEDSLKIVRLPG